MNTLELSNYAIGPYPFISKPREFNPKIWERKEFHKGKPHRGLKPHQRLVERYVSPVTPYDEVLLFHAMGSGKTRSALAAAENALSSSTHEDGPKINRIFVVGKTSKNVKIIFTEELKKMLRMRLGVDKLTEEQEERLNKHIKNKYIFMSYGTMGKSASQYSIGGKSIFNLLKTFDQSMFILDEAHNLTTDVGESQKQDIWKRFQKLFDILPNRKVILLSGTPMINKADDIIPLMNLILPPGKKLDKKIKSGTLNNAIAGRVSYIKEDIAGDVPKAVFDGVVSPPLKTFKLVYLAMSPFQSEEYRRAEKRSREESETSFDLELQRTALFAFPPQRQSRSSVKEWTRQGQLKPEFWETLKTNGRFDIEKLCVLSCKFAQVIKAAEEGPWPVYVYSNIVEGTRFKKTVGGGWVNTVSGAGLKLLSLILEKWGYSRFSKSSTSKRKRYMYFTGTASERPSAADINLFNQKGKNSNGEICRLVLGSEASSEGYTFRNIKREIVLTPHHHYAQIAQALARGIRVGAHDRGDNVRGAGKVHISRLVAVPIPATKKIKCGSLIKNASSLSLVNDKNNIDVRMYKRSEIKDIEIKGVENRIKRYAFDCAFNFDINARPEGEDLSRDCDYKDCSYRCAGMSKYRKPGGYSISESQLVKYTWNKYYAPNVRNGIKNQFRAVDRLSVFTLADVVGVDIEVVLNTLSEMIETREPVASRDGKTCYLCSYGEMVLLTFDIIEPIGNAAEAALYYVQNPVSYTKMTNYEYIKIAKYNNAKRNLRDYLREPRNFLNKANVLCGNCPNISTLPFLLQEKLLETAVVHIRKYRNTPRQNTSRFDLALSIRLYYSMALFEISVGNKTYLVSALLYTFRRGGVLRMIQTTPLEASAVGWKDASNDVIDAYAKKYDFTPQKRRDLEGKSYGLYNYKNCTFCVVKPKKATTKASEVNMGQNAYTLQQKDLVQIFETDNIDIETIGVDETFFNNDDAYFPWVAGAAQPEINKKKPMHGQGKPVLTGLLLLAWKKKNNIYLDTNCGLSTKQRVKGVR
jgi:hypothetical protein